MQSVTTTGENERVFLGAKDATKDNKRNSRDRSKVVLMKDVVSAENENGTYKTLKGVTPAAKRNYSDKSSNWTSHYQTKVGRADVDKGKNDGNTGGESQKDFKYTATTKRCSVKVKHDKRMEKMDSETSYKEKDEEIGGASDQLEVRRNSIVNRKQQRDAVDALLSSSLIPSKKSESWQKSSSVKRARSTTSSGGHQIRPPKPRKKGSILEASMDTGLEEAWYLCTWYMIKGVPDAS